MARTFNCKTCGDGYENPTANGRPPVRCVNCDPRAWSEAARAAAITRRRALEATEERLAALLAHVGDRAAAPVASARLPIANGRLADVRDEPRLALAQAVRNVGRACGNEELYVALDRLCRVADGWQRVLA